mmetsp:Transcript_45652/g.106489  ORF Transcript_45652/g.106489 Transcript_45652/m.106489 type:complete len:283 (+) Transcript_45652:202-1050(+)
MCLYVWRHCAIDASAPKGQHELLLHCLPYGLRPEPASDLLPPRVHRARRELCPRAELDDGVARVKTMQRGAQHDGDRAEAEHFPHAVRVEPVARRAQHEGHSAHRAPEPQLVDVAQLSLRCVDRGLRLGGSGGGGNRAVRRRNGADERGRERPEHRLEHGALLRGDPEGREERHLTTGPTRGVHSHVLEAAPLATRRLGSWGDLARVEVETDRQRLDLAHPCVVWGDETAPRVRCAAEQIVVLRVPGRQPLVAQKAEQRGAEVARRAAERRRDPAVAGLHLG